MIALLQRVSRAAVLVGGDRIAAMGPGLLVLIGVEQIDTEAEAERLLDRLLHYRVFADPTGRMNLSLLEFGGALLLVPQFTLAAKTGKGTRPSFSAAAPPELGQRLYTHLLEQARLHPLEVQSGRFGAPMQVELSNDGPVTFWLQARPRQGS